MEEDSDPEGELGKSSQRRKTPVHTAIVFGSPVARPARRRASVRATCEAIGLARSTYYYQSHRSSGAIAFEQKIVQRLIALREAHPDDGYRRMTRQLQLEGLHVNRKRIARLMHLHNLGVRVPPPDCGSVHNHHSTPTAVPPRENVQPTAVNQVWISDLAYVHITSGLIYTAAIIDAWSKEVVGYAASTHINPRLPALALHSAVRARRSVLGCVHHSTYGIQYLMRGYRELLRHYGLIPVATEGTSAPPLVGPVCVPPPSARQVVDLAGYTSWDEVVARADDFIRTLYSAQRIAAILGSQGKGALRETVGRGTQREATADSVK